MARIVDFFDGASSSTTPTIGNIVASDLITYANDAAYEAAELGSPAEGNLYFNTTLKLIRYYTGTSWVSIVDEESTQTIQNKTIDGTDATGNNTVTNDATDVTFDNTTSGMTATDSQGAIDEVEGRVDTNETDISNLETLSGSPGATDHSTFTGTTIPDNSDTKEALQSLETEVETKIDSSEKGANNGVATLDGSGKLPTSQLTVSAMEWLGNWNADTNTPTIVSSTGDNGDVYKVSVAGTTSIDGESDWAVEDLIIFNGTVWEKTDHSVITGANLTLSNLTSPTSINQDLIPNTDNSRQLGTSSKEFSIIRARSVLQGNNSGGSLILHDGLGGNTVSGQMSGETAFGVMPSTTTADFKIRADKVSGNIGLHTINNGSVDANDTGKVLIETGNKTAGTGDSGDIEVTVGTSAGGTRGTIKLKDGSEGTAGDVWTSSGTGGEGNWETPLDNYLSATSSVKTPTGGDVWMQMTGNSVTLTPGSWMITGTIRFVNNGSSPLYTYFQGMWATANGDDTATVPTGVTVDAGLVDFIIQPGSTSNNVSPMPVIRMTVGSNTTIYLDPIASLTTASNARVTTFIYAEQLS